MIPNHNLGVADDPRSMHERVIAKFDPSVGTDVEHGAQVGRSAAAIFDTGGKAAAEEPKTIGGLDIGCWVDAGVVGDFSIIPIPGQPTLSKAHETSPIT